MSCMSFVSLTDIFYFPYVFFEKAWSFHYISSLMLNKPIVANMLILLGEKAMPVHFGIRKKSTFPKFSSDA